MKDKRKLAGQDKINHDELAGVVSVGLPNETDLIQCGTCKLLHSGKINHKCYDIPYFSWSCAICNRETSKWVKVEHGYSQRQIIRKTVELWSKPVCKDCIFRAYKELKK